MQEMRGGDSGGQASPVATEATAGAVSKPRRLYGDRIQQVQLFFDQMESLMEQKEAKRQQRHSEKMQKFSEVIDLLKKAAENKLCICRSEYKVNSSQYKCVADFVVLYSAETTQCSFS